MALDCAAPIHKLLVSELGANRKGVGYINADSCTLDGHTRSDSLAQIGNKVHALLTDPACSSLVIGLTTSDIEANGLPVDRFAVSLLSNNSEVPEQLRDIIELGSGTVIEVSDIDDLKQGQLKDILQN